MRHRVKGRRLGRTTGQRKMLIRSLITEFFRHERIKTTSAKAKAIRGDAEKMITLARNRGDAERLVRLAKASDEDALKSLLTDAQTRRLLAAAEDDESVLEREALAIASHAQRLIARDITDREVVYKLFHDIAPRFVERNGGYTRLFKLGPRKGDRAEMVVLELVERET
jgi:large subunit ribosomal protein L17